MVYFTNHRRSVQVYLTDAGLAEARRWVALTRGRQAGSGSAAARRRPPLRVLLARSVCLPDENSQSDTPRRIAVSNPHGEILHLTVPGSRASLRRGRVIVSARREELASVPIERVVGLVVHGNVDVSSALLRELLWRGYSIVWCSGTGRVVGSARSTSSPNGMTRVRQHVASEAGHLGLAREFVAATIANQATQLRRNARGDVAPGCRTDAFYCKVVHLRT